MKRMRRAATAAAISAAVACFVIVAGGCESAPLRPGDSALGEPLFRNNCAACHELPEPAAYDRVEWRGILRQMGPRAGFDRQKQEDAFAWLESQCAGSSRP